MTCRLLSILIKLHLLSTGMQLKSTSLWEISIALREG